MSSIVSHSMTMRETPPATTHWSEAGAFVLVALIFIVISNLTTTLTDDYPDFGDT